MAAAAARALGRERRGLEDDPLDGALVGAARAGSVARRGRRARRDPGGDRARAVAADAPRAAVPARVRRRRAGVRAVVLLPGDPSPRDRGRAADRVPRATARRALGAVRLQGSGAAPDLGRARSGAVRAGADRQPVRRRDVALGRTACSFALAGAVAYATYVLLAEHVVGGRDAVSLLAWGFLFASVFWAVLAPWWSFPGHSLTRPDVAARAPGIGPPARLAARRAG